MPISSCSYFPVAQREALARQQASSALHVHVPEMSQCIRKTTKCFGENTGADQLRGNREADQRLCFRYTDSTIPLLLKYKVSSLLPSSVSVQSGLCRAWSKPRLLVFSRTGSNVIVRGENSQN